MVSPLEAGLAGIDEYLSANKGYRDAGLVRARCRAMLKVYDRVWEKDNEKYEVLSVEKLLLGPIKNIDSGKDSGYIGGGKEDLRLKLKDGYKVSILDHKNLSYEIDDDKLEHLLIDTQLNHYALMNHYNGVRVDSAIYDVLVKTLHRPKKATKAQPEESLEAFEERLTAVYAEQPRKYFARKEIPIFKTHLIGYANDLYDWTRLLDSAKQSGKHLKNPGACFEYNRPCRYLGLCTGRSEVADGSW